MHGTNIYIRYTICSVTDKNEELFDRTTVCGMLLNAVTHPIDIAINEKSVDGTARELEKERERNTRTNMVGECDTMCNLTGLYIQHTAIGYQSN